MKKIILLTLGMLALSARIYAQLPVNEAPPIEAPPYEISPNPSVVYPEEILQPDVIHATVYDPPPVAVTYSPNVFEELRANSLPGSFSQQAAWSLHNNFGFSLGAQEGYYFSEYPDESYYRVFGGKRSSSATSLSASVFTNYARGKSAIHLDYGANYSFYPQRRNTADDIIHSTSAAYIYRINDRARFQLRNQLTSSSNDPLADMFSVNSSSDRLMMGSYYFDALLTTRRYTRNTVTASLSSDITGKRTNVNVFGSYENYWYGEQAVETGALKDHYSATVGIGVYQGITSWLSLGTSYSIQLNDDLKENQAHRVEIGRLQFNLSQNTVVYTSGGVVISKNDNRREEGYEIRPTARAGISWSTEAGRLYAEYSRTMMSVSGSRRLLPSDTVSAGLGKPIGGRINLRLIGYYQRSSDSTDSGQLSVYQGQASLECLLVQGLSMSANYTYRYQDNSINVLGGIPYAERQTISAGLQYNWPSRRTGY